MLDHILVVEIIFLLLHQTAVALGRRASLPSCSHRTVLAAPFVVASFAALEVTLWPCSLMPCPWHQAIEKTVLHKHREGLLAHKLMS